MSIYICEPVYTNYELNPKEQNVDLMNRAMAEMQEVINLHPSYEFWKYIPEQEFDYSKYKKKEK